MASEFGAEGVERDELPQIGDVGFAVEAMVSEGAFVEPEGGGGVTAVIVVIEEGCHGG